LKTFVSLRLKQEANALILKERRLIP